MYKFEGFKQGDVVRSHDFQNRSAHGACYIEGVVCYAHPKGNAANGGPHFAHYVVYIIKDVYRGVEVKDEDTRVGEVAYVPMEKFMDYDGRVTKINEVGLLHLPV